MPLINFIVTVPENTPEYEEIYITGNHICNWNPEATPLEQIDGRTYKIDFDFDYGTYLEYKFTRGTWGTVEAGEDFQPVPNRILTVNDDRDVYIDIENWNDLFHLNWNNTLTGNFRVHRNFYSHAMDDTRTIMVYLPPGYTGEKARYPVLYIHDGQNVFDASTSYGGVEWEVDETAERLINAGKIEKLIIIGIYNDKDRADEYTPSYDDDEHSGGKAEYYADFIINELKPFIDKNYRTKKDARNTAVMGSSLGGLCSLYFGWKHNDVFSKIGVISPSLWWDDREILKEIEEDENFTGPEKIWLDVGTLEGNDPDNDGVTDMVENTRYLEELLVKKGYVLNENLFYLEAEGKVHNEAAWRDRVESILVALFGL